MKVVVLAGGVGGARFADGVRQVLPPEDVTVVVNIGDDFTYYGLQICPDLDTVCYTLAGLGNPETGWGRKCDSQRVMGELSKMGDQVWFQVGDLDLATHLYRTEMLSKNIALSRITHNLCRAWDIHVSILPATDCKVPTIVHTREGESLSFQEYFVHRGCLPEVKAFEFQGVAAANPAAGVAEAIGACDLVLVAPSNPWVSVDPILSITGIRAALEAKPVIAVSPIIGGKTIKGPAAKMFAELGIIPSASSVAEHYGKLLKGFVLDETDREQKGDIDRRGIMTLTTNILMGPDRDRGRLAREVLDFAKNQLQVAI